MSVTKIILSIMAIGFVASLLPAPTKDVVRPGTDQVDNQGLDFSKPIYTQSYAIVCPLGILFDTRESHGIAAANKAATTIIGRSKAINDAGCEEWRAGKRLYISDTGSDRENTWLHATPYSDSPSELLVLRITLTNNRDGSP